MVAGMEVWLQAECSLGCCLHGCLAQGPTEGAESNDSAYSPGKSSPVSLFVVVILVFGFQAKSRDAQGLILALSSRIMPGSAQGTL